jgi:predicted MFS family arabinose efflux permease
MSQPLLFALAFLFPAVVCAIVFNRLIRSRVAAALIVGATTTMITHVIAYVVDGGYDALVAVSVVIAFLFAAMIGRVIGQFVPFRLAG